MHHQFQPCTEHGKKRHKRESMPNPAELEFFPTKSQSISRKPPPKWPFFNQSFKKFWRQVPTCFPVQPGFADAGWIKPPVGAGWGPPVEIPCRWHHAVTASGRGHTRRTMGVAAGGRRPCSMRRTAGRRSHPRRRSSLGKKWGAMEMFNRRLV